jgi:curved DNA-binding protein CbpA
MPSRRIDHYAVLGLSSSATQRQIRAAFRRLARATHPDGHAERTATGTAQAGDAATTERRFKRIARAYEVLGDPSRRKAYDERLTRGRFAPPGTVGRATFQVDAGPVYHSDLGHHSDFYQTGDPLSVADAAALVSRDGGWIRRAIRAGRLPATRGPGGYLLRRRDVERLDRTARRRRDVPAVSTDADGAKTDTTQA